MTTRNGSAGLMHDDRELGASNTAGALYMPWQTLSAWANETGQAVRQTFAESGVTTGGHVEQSSQHHIAPDRLSKPDQSEDHETLLDSGQVDVAHWKATDSAASSRVDAEAVQADISKVKRKMLSTDAATEVILRFNFMSGWESRVRNACLAGPQRSTYRAKTCCIHDLQAALLLVAASIFVGAAVLITEFVHKMKVVSKPAYQSDSKYQDVVKIMDHPVCARTAALTSAPSTAPLPLQLFIQPHGTNHCRAINHSPTKTRPHTSGTLLLAAHVCCWLQ